MNVGAVVADGAAPVRREEFVVASSIDLQPLRGEVDWPAAPSRAVVVIYPGSGTHTRANGTTRSDIAALRAAAGRDYAANAADVSRTPAGMRTMSRCQAAVVP